MAAFSQKLLGFYGVFRPHAVSLAVLTGLTFTLVVRALFIPAMESSPFITIRNLYNYCLGWVTPPCLFVVMNGIIVVLSTSSGMFTCPVSEKEDDFEVCTADNAPKLQSLGASKGETLIGVSREYGECELPGAHGRNGTYEKGCVRKEDDEEEEKGGEEGKKEDEEEEEEYYELHDTEEGHENGTRLVRESLASKSFSFAETRVFRGVDGGTHDRVVYPFVRNKSMKRSFSIDSCPYHDNQTILSIEELSDEAFKKRIEEFISLMNAKLRNEVKK